MTVIDRASEALFDMLGQAIAAPAIHHAAGYDEPRARTTDPVTAHEAADSISPEAREASEVWVLATLAEHGPMSDGDVWDWYVLFGPADNWSDSRLRTARSQLVRKGLVIEADKNGLSRAGRRVARWAVAS